VEGLTNQLTRAVSQLKEGTDSYADLEEEWDTLDKQHIGMMVARWRTTLRSYSPANSSARNSAGTRKMTTVGTGLWRWAFRGGASREAYRTLLAAGVDWLLGGEPVERGQSLVVSSVVTRGEPVVFSWDQGIC